MDKAHSIAVEDFRAPTDGDDWAPAVQRALDYSRANGHPTVTASSGLVHMQSTLHLQAGDRIAGRGGAALFWSAVQPVSRWRRLLRRLARITH